MCVSIFFLSRSFLIRVQECVGHGLLVPFAVRSARPGDFVARIRFTVAVHQGEPVRLCSHPPPFVSSEFSPADEELRALLTAPAKNEGPSEALPLSIKVGLSCTTHDLVSLVLHRSQSIACSMIWRGQQLPQQTRAKTQSWLTRRPRAHVLCPSAPSGR